MSLSKVRNAFARWQSCNVIWERSYTVSFMVAKADFQIGIAEITNFLVRLWRRKRIKNTIEFWTNDSLYAEGKHFDCQIEIFGKNLKVYETYKVVGAIQTDKVNRTIMYEGEVVEKFGWES